MTTTTFASPFFDDSNDGFTKGERVRVITGEHAGKFGTIDQALPSGYYFVEVEGTDATQVYDYHMIEPLTQPVQLALFPEAPAYGMTSAALAEEVSKAITRATTRVLGVGAQQYSTRTSQKFEDQPLKELFEGLLEEADDLINYGVMVQIRIRRMIEALGDVT